MPRLTKESALPDRTDVYDPIEDVVGIAWKLTEETVTVIWTEGRWAGKGHLYPVTSFVRLKDGVLEYDPR